MRPERHPGEAERTAPRMLFWRNYLAHSIEGGLYMGGTAFLAAESVGPVMLRSLGAPDAVIAFAPIAVLFGVGLAPLMTARRVERLHHFKPFVMSFGIFQRLAFLPAAFALFFLAASHPVLTWALVAGAPLVSGLLCGVHVVAWMELVARVIPSHRRASAAAIRLFVGTVVGLAAGPVIRRVLDAHPGPAGYGILHLLLFLFLAGSYAVFAAVREPPVPRLRLDPSRAETRVGRFDALRGDRRLRLVAAGRVLTCGIYILLPFLSIHALQRTGRPDSFVGALVTAQMLGALAGNVAGGWMGDRFGGRRPMLLGRATLALACAASALAATPLQFQAIYAALGAGLHLNAVGDSALTFEVASAERRRPFFTALTFLGAPAMVGAVAISAGLRRLGPAIWPAAALGAAALAAAWFVTRRIVDPRREHEFLRVAPAAHPAATARRAG